MERRNTIQRELVLNAVRELCGHVSADEVHELIKKEHPTVGKGTIYRNLNILAEEGKIKKIEIPGGPDRFDFTVKEHYHVQCIRCNQLFDVDMDLAEDLKSRIRNPHGIQFLKYDILFKGICPVCQEASERKEDIL